MSEVINPSGVSPSTPTPPSTEAPTTEVKAPEVAPVKENTLSPKFAALARKEREILRAKEAMRAREYKLAQQEKEYQQYLQSKQNAKQNPIEALKALGLTYQEITDYMLNGEKPTAETQIQSVQQQMQKYIEQQEMKEKQRLEQEAQAVQQQHAEIIHSFKGQINSFVDQNKDAYELTHLYGAQDLIYDTIAQHFEATQQIMDTKQAAQLVEEYLESEYEKAMNTKKISSRFKRAEEPKKEQVNVNSGFQSKTLNNGMVSSAAPSLLSPKTENDRIQRALAALNK